jgi:hypothetical protein
MTERSESEQRVWDAVFAADYIDRRTRLSWPAGYAIEHATTEAELCIVELRRSRPEKSK